MAQNQAQPKPNTNGQSAEGNNQATAARQGERAAVTAVGALLRDGLEPQPSNDADSGDAGSADNGEQGAEGSAAQPGAASGDGKKREPIPLTKIAETLGVKVEDLYELVEVRDGANGDGETRTLGALKDLATGVTDLEARELQFEERRVGAENELLRARQDMAFIVSQLPASAVTPEMKKRAQAERERIEKVERARTLDAIPEWSDEAIEQKERDEISAYMAGYGFGANDLDRINDHRWLKLLRDNTRLKARVARAIDAVKEDKSRPAGSSAASGQPRAEQKPQPGAQQKANPQKQQVSKIGKLLREGA